MIKTLYDLPTLIFWLLSLVRANPGCASRQKAAFSRYRDVFRRVSFWLRLCQKAGLLTEIWPLAPGPLVSDWLSWPVDRQWSYLLRVWKTMLADPYRRKERQRLFDQLSTGQITVWRSKTAQELAGLCYLGLWAPAQGLTALGKTVLVERMRGLPEPVFSPWQVQDQEVLAAFPANWRLLWELETFLAPFQPGRYLLGPAALRQASQRGDVEKLAFILEAGSGQPLPPAMRQRILRQPEIHVLPGALLEFSSPDELAALRGMPSLRPRLERQLSPRAVWVAQQDATALLRRLENMGFLAPGASVTGLGAASPDGLPAHCLPLNSAERVYLAGLIRAVETLHFPASPPEGLLERLEAGLGTEKVQAGVRLAERIVSQQSPPRWLPPEPDLPELPPVSLLEILQIAIHQEETVEVSYHVPGRPSAETRRLSPLSIEERGGRSYLLAYCHTRRGNRTFRLDRLTLTGSP